MVGKANNNAIHLLLVYLSIALLKFNIIAIEMMSINTKNGTPAEDKNPVIVFHNISE